MGLYLTIFDGDDEVDGVEVGRYEDFHAFRHNVTELLEGNDLGSRFPTLIMHSDCDGEWTPEESAQLIDELGVIDESFKQMPAKPELMDGWKSDVARTFCLEINTLNDCFFDVDGEPLIERLIDLARLSIEKKKPILFQ